MQRGGAHGGALASTMGSYQKELISVTHEETSKVAKREQSPDSPPPPEANEEVRLPILPCHAGFLSTALNFNPPPTLAAATQVLINHY